MKKLTVEKILTIFFLALIVILLTLPVFAAPADDSATGDDTTDFLDINKVKGSSTSAATSTGNFLNGVLGIVQVVAVTIAVIMLIILGIKYVSASPSEKADIKQGAMIYVVGAILLFGSAGILQIIKGLAGTIS